MRLRDDVVLQKVSGVNVLVSLRSAWDSCPFAQQIGPRAALIWQLLREGSSEDEVLSALQEKYHLTREAAEKAFLFFAKDAEKYHYSVSEENDA